jgi:tricorn protease
VEFPVQHHSEEGTNVFNLRAPAALLLLGLGLHAETRLLRFPDIHGDKVVFTYGGDLWTAPATGGTATRLTAHPGLELFAKFSPDGQWIAFTGQYDGDEQVYVMPSTGGVPRQLTFYPARGPLAPRWGYDNQVYGWTNDGKRILFRSLRDGWATPLSRLYSVSIDGGLAEVLPMPESGAASYSPAGNRLVYSPRARDFRTEKRYSGGQANQLYIFDTETFDARLITQGPRANRDPMWIGKSIYFDSDRDGKFNLYSYDTGSGKTTQVTFFKDWDLRWPSTDRERRIVYERDGQLEVYDIQTRKTTPILITVPDDGVARRPARVSAANLIEGASLSPKGERVVFVARGDVFSAPVAKGPTRNLTHSSRWHEKWARWSPDGSKIAYISDQSGEEEVWVTGQDGLKPAEQITTGGKAFRYAPEWSPDSKRIAFSDKDGKVFVVTLDDRKQIEVAQSHRGEVRDYRWSPRGGFLAFSMAEENGVPGVWVWSGKDNQARRVTDPFFNAHAPAWDADGNYLFYLSTREFAPLISRAEFNFATTRDQGIFAMTLRKDVKHPFPPESDEVTVTKDEPKPPDKDKDALKPPPTLTIDFEGIAGRVARVPVEANNYLALSAKSGHLIYTTGPNRYYGRGPDGKTALHIFAFKDRKDTVLLEDVNGFTLSQDGQKALVVQQQNWFEMDATPTGAAGKKPVSTAGLYLDRVPAEEWAEIFDEVWRRYRDFFYAKNMHGYDWEALRAQYRPLLQHVANRADLNYVVSEMISELTVQHAYIEGGDLPIPPRPRVALPGARFSLDRASNRYRISRIFAGENEEDTYRSPLTEIGVEARVGDYVLAINGVELNGVDNPYRLLRNAADNPVALTLNSKPSMEGSRIVTYRPIMDESKLLYLDWVERNRRKVAELSGGRVAYIHVPDMGNDGIREFIKWYYPQIRKEGLVVDVRVNGGGNVSRMLIERLRRKLLAAQFSRTVDTPGTYPDAVFVGPMVCLLNENSSSDGDIFPAMFREAGLGPLIGKRSWGGVVGITNHGQLIDGGTVNVPEFGFTNAKGDWIIEGHGVDPDIEVENDPRSVIQGKDPQLERGVAEVMKRLEANPRRLPVRPPDPVKLK